jgi:hypothetical protein
MDNNYSFLDETASTNDDFQGFKADDASDIRQLQTIKHLFTPLMLLERLPILDLCIQLIKNGLLLF